MILIIFNVLLSTKEPLKYPIMNFLVLGEMFRRKRKVHDEEGERRTYAEEQLQRRQRHGMYWCEGAKEARG
ncbi:hypothetical protein AMTRI_Chr10g226220 [Amborella trichopoda]